METTNVTIRPLLETDLSQAGEVISNASIPIWKTEGINEETMKELLERNSPENLATRVVGNHFYVAEDNVNHRIIGIIGLRPDEGSPVPNRLSTFYIDPLHQGKGIGRGLYEVVLQKAKDLGVKKMVVSSSPNAEPIYEHFGFKRVRLDWKEHSDGRKSYQVWMEQDLEPI